MACNRQAARNRSPARFSAVEPIDLTRYTQASDKNSNFFEATAALMFPNKRSVPPERKLDIEN
jgi:hypothetical protein